MKENYNYFGTHSCMMMNIDSDDDIDDDIRFKPPIEEKICTLEFESEKCKFSFNLNENEMKQLVGKCAKAFGLKAVISAASEADVDDDE